MLPRRSGDIAAMYADSSLAQKELNWQPKYGLEKMCKLLDQFMKSGNNS